ncbi:hypothetical protein [Streptomyces sp. NPDC018045]
MEAFGTADRLASFVGLPPVPRDSDRVSDTTHCWVLQASPGPRHF